MEIQNAIDHADEAEKLGYGNGDGAMSALVVLRDELIRVRAILKRSKDLIEVSRMPNIEHVADAHNEAVRALRNALGE